MKSLKFYLCNLNKMIIEFGLILGSAMLFSFLSEMAGLPDSWVHTGAGSIIGYLIGSGITWNATEGLFKKYNICQRFK